MIAAPGSGSGKTTITCAMLEALKRRGLNVRAFKCGPDYIDPIFHNEVLGIRSRNLDTFFSDEDELRALYAYDNECDVTVVEGVMGLYDGLSPDSDAGSSYEIARILGLPIVLIVDAHGMGRSVIALIRGFQSMDEAGLIRGVILNRMTASYYGRIAPVIEAETGLKVFGYMPKLAAGISGERYLGLKLPAGDETGRVRDHIGIVAGKLTDSVDMDAILLCSEAHTRREIAADIHIKMVKGDERVRIGIARDEAFCFYYEDNLRLLREAGAELVEFSPLSDSRIPDGICGLILGGGYPELYADRLSVNSSMIESIRNAINTGMPSVAECGGFMYLHDAICTADGQRCSMVGAVSGTCAYTGHLVRFGMVSVEDSGHRFLPAGAQVIRGHEFHYYDSDNNGADCTARKHSTGTEWSCAHVAEDHWWGFAHLYYQSDPDFVRTFVKKCMEYDNQTDQTR